METGDSMTQLKQLLGIERDFTDYDWQHNVATVTVWQRVVDRNLARPGRCR